MQANFHQADFDQPHPQRTRAILKAHPEVRTLMVRNPYTALIACLILAVQVSIVFAMGRVGPAGAAGTTLGAGG